MSSERYLQISSKYRTNQNDPSHNCLVEMPAIMRKGIYRLAYALVPNTFYTVNSSNNKLFLREATNAEIEITLPIGFYDNTTFPIMLKEELDKAGTQPYTVTLTTRTNKITILGNNNVLFGFAFTGKANTCHTLIGFRPQDTTFNTNFSFTCPNMINLSTVHTINISIDGISSISQRNLQGTSFIIPVPAGSLNYLNYVSTDAFEQTVEIYSDKRIIQVVIKDELNNVLDLNGVDWLLVLEKQHTV